MPDLASIRAAVKEGAHRRLLPKLLARAKEDHKRGWRDCDCDWCALKREATVEIADMGHIPRYRDIHGYDDREAARACKRVRYRALLAEKFEE